MKRRQVIIGYVAMMLSGGLVSPGGTNIRKVQAIAPAGEITDVNTLETLKQAFQLDEGKVRLVTLLSPI